MQKKRYSLLEVLCDNASGFVLALIVQQILFPIMGIYITNEKGVIIISVFTAVALVRKYIWRRLFNYLHSKGYMQ